MLFKYFDNGEIILFNGVMKINKVELGKRIKEALDNAGINQRQLSQALGVKDPSVTAYIQGTSNLPAYAYATISELCHVSIDWIIKGKNAAGVAPKPEITYPLAETEKNALQTAESIIERFGLDKRFQVVEIHHMPGQHDITMTEDEQRLFKAFRSLDPRRQERLIEDAEDMVLARKESLEKGHTGGGLMDQSCG